MDLKTQFDGTVLTSDWLMESGLLAQEAGMNTAIALSLFTDGALKPDDPVPEGDASPKGWWGDVVAPAQAPVDAPWRTGSRLRLLAREKQLPETLRRAETYCREALDWLPRLKIAERVDVVATWVDTGVMGLVITVHKAAAVVERYAYLWAANDNLVYVWKDAA